MLGLYLNLFADPTWNVEGICSVTLLPAVLRDVLREVAAEPGGNGNAPKPRDCAPIALDAYRGKRWSNIDAEMQQLY